MDENRYGPTSLSTSIGGTSAGADPETLIEALKVAREALIHMCKNTIAEAGYRGEKVDAALARIDALTGGKHEHE